MLRGERGGDVGTGETRAVSAFLRALAARAEADPALAEQIAAALRESGLMAGDVTGNVHASLAAKPRGRKRSMGRAPEGAGEAPDPFVLLRERGEAGLRATLEGMELAVLRQIVRTHRLDPARISARWTARERVITLIVDQVRARANHGKAFSRV